MKTTVLHGIVDFIVPSCCLHCSKAVSGKNFLCSDCRDQLEYADSGFVQRPSTLSNQCFESLLTLYQFNKDKPIQAVLHKIKYGDKFKLALLLGEEFADRFADILRSLNITGIIPVPLYHSRKAERGYNQTYYFAKGISKKTGIRVMSRLLKRTRFTDTQTMLTREERAQNVSGAFKISRNLKVQLNSYLLVDDVFTTGSTINECAKVLKDKGASKVYAGTIAIA